MSSSQSENEIAAIQAKLQEVERRLTELAPAVYARADEAVKNARPYSNLEHDEWDRLRAEKERLEKDLHRLHSQTEGE